MGNWNSDEFDAVRSVAHAIQNYSINDQKKIILASLVMVGSDGLLVDAETYQGIRWATAEPGDKD